MTKSDEIRPKTIEASTKTLNVIEALRKLGVGGVTEIAEVVDISKSSAYFHLSTLRSKGFVVKEDSGYRLSLRFQEFGGYVKMNHPLYDVAKPAIEELAEEIGEPSYCHVEEHGLATTLCVSEVERGMTTVIRGGTQSRMHYTAAGKAILAHLPEERVHEIIDRWGLPGPTDKTITDRAKLLDSLAEGRKRGYFETREEFEQGLSAVGVPIIGEDGVYGAISIGAPERRVRDLLQGDEFKNALLATANMIEVNISFS